MKLLSALFLLLSVVFVGQSFGPIPDDNAGLSATSECLDSGCNSFNVHYFGSGGYSHTELWSSGMLVIQFHDFDQMQKYVVKSSPD